MISHHIVTLCHEYARLECVARAAVSLQRLDPDIDRSKVNNRQRTVIVAKPVYAKIYRAAGRMLVDMAPPEAVPHLDAVKKVMEIDTDTMDVNTFLLRASVIVP